MAQKPTLPTSGRQVKDPKQPNPPSGPANAPRQQFNSLMQNLGYDDFGTGDPSDVTGYQNAVGFGPQARAMGYGQPPTLPPEVGQSVPNIGTWGSPSPTPPVKTPMPPSPRPPGRGVPAVAANVARPPVLPARVPMPPIYSPLQTGNVRGGAPPIYTAANLGPILNRLFGGGQT